MPRLKTAGAAQAPAETPGASGLFVHSMPGHLVRRLQQVAVRLFGDEVASDLTPVQFAALAAVSDRPNIGQAALAALIGYDRATMGGVIERLEQKGWLTRNASPDDRRSNVLCLTAAGKRILAASIAEVERAQQKLLEPLTAGEQRQFEAMCLKILAHHRG